MKEVAVETSVTGILASTTILLAVMVLLSLVAMTLMYRYFSHIAKQQNEMIEALQKNVSVIENAAIESDKRLLKSDNKFKQLARRQYLYEVQQMKNKNYERAKDMILRGENIKHVIEKCNITKIEAELILLANRMNKVA